MILSTGWLGNLDALNLEAAGVERRGNYVQVDDTLRTTAATFLPPAISPGA